MKDKDFGRMMRVLPAPLARSLLRTEKAYIAGSTAELKDLVGTSEGVQQASLAVIVQDRTHGERSLVPCVADGYTLFAIISGVSELVVQVEHDIVEIWRCRDVPALSKRDLIGSGFGVGYHSRNWASNEPYECMDPHAEDKLQVAVACYARAILEGIAPHSLLLYHFVGIDREFQKPVSWEWVDQMAELSRQIDFRPIGVITELIVPDLGDR